MKKLFLCMVTISIVLFIFFYVDAGTAETPVNLGQYTVIAWNDLGMHCIDHDYSVFAILPPFNNLHAQVIDRYTGTLVSSGVILTYRAARDTDGSINTTSIGKINFWDFVLPLFGMQLLQDTGLTGNPVQSLTPAPMIFNPTYGYWEADGIPVVPYNDHGLPNYYPMVKVAVKRQDGTTLAVTKTVLPVSDEMRCKRCHKSNTGILLHDPQQAG